MFGEPTDTNLGWRWPNIPNADHYRFDLTNDGGDNELSGTIAQDHRNVGVPVGETSNDFDNALPSTTYTLTLFAVPPSGSTLYTESAGGVSSYTTTAANNPPIADAGPDQNVDAGELVTLDGSGSSDSDGTIISYGWEVLAGNPGPLSNANTAMPSFTAPSTSQPQTITFRLRVTDNNDAYVTDNVDITVAAASTPSFSDDTGDAQSWTVGAAISPITVPLASGSPVPTYAVVGSLPGGINFSTSSRRLTGTPTAVQSGTIRIRATNSQGSDDWTVAYTTAAVGAPDLTIDAPTRNPSGNLTPGQSFTLLATVRNSGDASAGATTLRWRQSTNPVISTSDSQIGTDFVTALSAGAPSPENISLIAPSAPGTYYYGATVDSVTDESDTGNNASSGVALTVVASAVPPETPGTPTVTASTTTSISLSTVPGGGGAATLYRWRYSDNSSVTNSDPMITSTGPTVTISGLDEDTNYWIDVRAENSDGESGYSGDRATFTMAPVPSVTPAPTLSVVLGAPTTIATDHLTWQNRDAPVGLLDASGLSSDSDPRYILRFRLWRDARDTGQLYLNAVRFAPDGFSGFDSGDDLTDTWEASATAIRLSAPNGDFISVGPNHPDATSTDDSEPYQWNPASVTDLNAWITGFLALSSGDQALLTFTLDDGTTVVPDSAPVFSDDTGDAQTWTTNVAITPIAVPEAIGNPTPAYAVVGSLPAGINFNTSTRFISGTPTTIGSGTITIRASNSEGSDDWTIDYTTMAVANQNPTANAGPNQSVAAGASVDLDGTASDDSDGVISSYTWAQTTGTIIALTGANTSTPSFTAPSTNSAQVLTFQLTVTDDDGATATDLVAISVAEAGAANVAPSANAGPDQDVGANETVNLDGTGSSDSDGTIESYDWVQIQGATRTLTGANTSTPSFTTYPSNLGYTLIFRLTVTDNDGDTATDTVNINVAAEVVPPTPASEIRGFWVNDLVGSPVNMNKSLQQYGAHTTRPDGNADLEGVRYFCLTHRVEYFCTRSFWIRKGNNPGQLSLFDLDAAPAGWLLCDGSTFDANDHTELYSARNGNNVLPNLTTPGQLWCIKT